MPSIRRPLRLRLALAASLAVMPAAATAAPPAKLAPVGHIIVLYLENHSFDNLFGTFPGADGIANAGKTAIQMDASGTPYAMLPEVRKDGQVDPRFPGRLANHPFRLSDYVPASEKTGDLIHRFYQLQAQIDNGRMDRFAQVSDAGGLTMGYYEEKKSPLWQYAQRYTLADHFFTAAFGGSMLNHFWLVCACTPKYEDAPAELRSILDAKGSLVYDAPLTPDGYVVNTIMPAQGPVRTRDATRPRLPLLNLTTIGERLDEKGIDWAWYAGGWNNVRAAHPDASYQPHHNPFHYFARYAAGTEGEKRHLKDESDFLTAIHKGTLPPVSFYKPLGDVDMHPGYSAVDVGEEHVDRIIRAIEDSPLWRDSIIVVTFDDAGGFWDHVAPPRGDRFGPGERVPTLVISPFAKRGFVDHTTYDTTSILRLIEERFDLKPLGDRDARAADLTKALKD